MKSSHLSNAAVLVVMIFFSACSGKSDNNKAVLNAMQESMENSNTSINISSTQILHSLVDKSRDYSTKEKAEIWLPRAQQIQKLSAEIFNYLEELKKTNKVNSETANELLVRLMKHKENILAVDSSIRYEFDKNIILITRTFDTAKQTENGFYNTFFRNSAALLISAMLSKLQNNIKIIENNTLTYCHNMTGSLDGDGFNEAFAALAVANKNYLKPGEFIEITAGVGGFSTAVSPEFIINRKVIKIDNAIGAAQYKMKVPLMPGNYFVPVKIKYTDQNGIKQELQKNIDYTVIKPCDQ